MTPTLVRAAAAEPLVISAPVGGGGTNPAGVLGPMLVAGRPDNWWVSVTAPILGGALAVMVTAFFSPPAVHPEREVAAPW